MSKELVQITNPLQRRQAKQLCRRPNAPGRTNECIEEEKTKLKNYEPNPNYSQTMRRIYMLDFGLARQYTNANGEVSRRQCEHLPHGPGPPGEGRRRLPGHRQIRIHQRTQEQGDG